MNALVSRSDAAPEPARSAETRALRLWLPAPLSILWTLLAPAAMIASLFAWCAPPRYRVNGPLAAARIGVLLYSLSGTMIEVRNRKADIFILIF